MSPPVSPVRKLRLRKAKWVARGEWESFYSNPDLAASRINACIPCGGAACQTPVSQGPPGGVQPVEFLGKPHPALPCASHSPRTVWDQNLVLDSKSSCPSTGKAESPQ